MRIQIPNLETSNTNEKDLIEVHFNCERYYKFILYNLDNKSIVKMINLTKQSIYTSSDQKRAEIIFSSIANLIVSKSTTNFQIYMLLDFQYNRIFGYIIFYDKTRQLNLEENFWEIYIHEICYLFFGLSRFKIAG